MKNKKQKTRHKQMCLTQQGTQITIPLQKAEMNKNRNDTLKKVFVYDCFCRLVNIASVILFTQ